MAYNIPFLHVSRDRAPVVKRSGWGRKEGRPAVLSVISITFWVLIARIAMRQGRIVVVTSSDDESIRTAMRLLPGPEFWPSAEGDDEDAEALPESGNFKIMSAANFHHDVLRALLTGLAEDQRIFSIASTQAEWLRAEVRLYRSQPGALPVFALHLD